MCCRFLVYSGAIYVQSLSLSLCEHPSLLVDISVDKLQRSHHPSLHCDLKLVPSLRTCPQSFAACHTVCKPLAGSVMLCVWVGQLCCCLVCLYDTTDACLCVCVCVVSLAVSSQSTSELCLQYGDERALCVSREGEKRGIMQALLYKNENPSLL